MAERNTNSAFEAMNDAMEDLYNCQALNEAIIAVTEEAGTSMDNGRKYECANNANRLATMLKKRLAKLVEKLDEESIKLLKTS